MISVVLLTRAMPSANALVRRIRAVARLELIICERLPPRPVRSVIDRFPRDVAALLRSPAGRMTAMGFSGLGARIDDRLGALLGRRPSRERIAVETVYGSRVVPLRDPLPIEHVTYRGWTQAEALLAGRRPDVIVAFGTSILPDALCAQARIAAINIHPGLTPYYRGNHCVEFAILNDDLDNLGTTLHVVSPRVDLGDIIAQGRPEILASDDEHTLMHRTLDLGHRLLADLLVACADGQLPAPRPQHAEHGLCYRSRAFTRGHAMLVRQLVARGAVSDYVRDREARRGRQKPIYSGFRDASGSPLSISKRVS